MDDNNGMGVFGSFVNALGKILQIFVNFFVDLVHGPPTDNAEDKPGKEDTST